MECQVLFIKYSGCHVDDLKYPELLPLPQEWKVAWVLPRKCSPPALSVSLVPSPRASLSIYSSNDGIQVGGSMYSGGLAEICGGHVVMQQGIWILTLCQHPGRQLALSEAAG